MRKMTVDTILKNGDKALSGMPYLYRSEGLPRDINCLKQRIRVTTGVMRSGFRRKNFWMPVKGSARHRSHI